MFKTSKILTYCTVFSDPLKLDLLGGVAPGLKLDTACLNIDWELLELHLTVHIKVDSLAESHQFVTVDSKKFKF